MNLVSAIAFALALVGREPDGLRRYVAAVLAATDDEAEQRVLIVVARHENYFHLHAETSGTPPFGLTDREVRLGLPRASIEASAVIARDSLRYLHGVCGSWSAALGRYHHGVRMGPRGEAHGCWADALARREALEAHVR